MKLGTTYRYVAWDVNGTCWSYEVPPVIREGGWMAAAAVHSMSFERQIAVDCPDKWNERYYDTESEEDMKLLQALMEL